MKQLLFALCTATISIALTGCSEDCCGDVFVTVGISVINEDSVDLLDPSEPSAYIEEDIKIFYLINGMVEEVYFSNLDSPKNFIIGKGSPFYTMDLVPNRDGSTTYIQWSDSDTDTLVCEFDTGTNRARLTSARFNGELKYQYSFGLEDQRFFTVVK
ncbi:MAG: hypothetical protein ABJN36_12100 [Cyclobacteriaceae bacterium]